MLRAQNPSLGSANTGWFELRRSQYVLGILGIEVEHRDVLALPGRWFASRRKVEDRADVGAQAEPPYRSGNGVREQIGAREPYAGNPISNQESGQSSSRAGRVHPRPRNLRQSAAALDQTRPKPRAEHVEQGLRRKPSRHKLEGDEFDVGRQLSWRLDPVATQQGLTRPSFSTRASLGIRPWGSMITRTGEGPGTVRVVSWGSSAVTVWAPTTTASTSARSRCRCSRSSAPET